MLAAYDLTCSPLTKRLEQAMRPTAEWAIDSEAMRARGINLLVKSN